MEHDDTRPQGRLHHAKALREQYYALAKALLEGLPVNDAQNQALKALDMSMAVALACLDDSYATEEEPKG